MRKEFSNCFNSANDKNKICLQSVTLKFDGKSCLYPYGNEFAVEIFGLEIWRSAQAKQTPSL